MIDRKIVSIRERIGVFCDEIPVFVILGKGLAAADVIIVRRGTDALSCINVDNLK